MINHTREEISANLIEVFPPDRGECPGLSTKTCLCCRQPKPASAMDVDGCGICEECLSP